jgi:hypothetical protein
MKLMHGGLYLMINMVDKCLSVIDPILLMSGLTIVMDTYGRGE